MKKTPTYVIGEEVETFNGLQGMITAYSVRGSGNITYEITYGTAENPLQSSWVEPCELVKINQVKPLGF